MTDQAKRIGVAIIGAGERGVYFIGSRIAEAAGRCGLRIIGVQDLLSDRADLAAAHLNTVYETAGSEQRVCVFPSLDEAVGDPRVDLVVVTTHTDSHRGPVERAVAAGKRVYLDKPIAVSLEDAEAIARAEADSGQPIMMGFTRRYEQSWKDSVQIARSGRIGTPRMVLLRSVIPPVDAAKCSADRLAAIEAGERHMPDELDETPICEAKTQAVLQTSVRQTTVRRGAGATMARAERDLPIDPARNQSADVPGRGRQARRREDLERHGALQELLRDLRRARPGQTDLRQRRPREP